MQQIQITEDALPVLKTGMILQKKLISLKIEDYLNRLRRFEEKYQMSSDKFIRDFEAGKLGDDEDWFDWLFVYESYRKAVRKKTIIEDLRL